MQTFTLYPNTLCTPNQFQNNSSSIFLQRHIEHNYEKSTWFEVVLPLSFRGQLGRMVDCISVLGDWGGFSGVRPPLNNVGWGFLGGGGGGTTGLCTTTTFGAGELFPKERTERLIIKEMHNPKLHNPETVLTLAKHTQSCVELLCRWHIWDVNCSTSLLFWLWETRCPEPPH